MPFSGPKWPICPEQIFFGTGHYSDFHLPIGPFHCTKLKKKLLSWIQSYEDAPSLGPKWSISPNFFFGNYYYHSYLPISPFHCSKFQKNSSNGSRVMRMHNFLAQNGPFPQMRIFSENLLMSLVSFIHAYLHPKNQSQILIYYWFIDN